MGRGAAVKVVGGKYAGHQGWLDTGKHCSSRYTYVILKVQDSEKKTKVLHENYLLLTEIKVPKSYEEAVFAQHDDINEALNILVKKLAECELLQDKGDSGSKLVAFILSRLSAAKKRQDEKGSRARWRRVVWPPKSKSMM